jgi:hypothetical protein
MPGLDGANPKSTFPSPPIEGRRFRDSADSEEFLTGLGALAGDYTKAIVRRCRWSANLFTLDATALEMRLIVA